MGVREAELENCRNEGLVPIIVSASVSLYMDELTSILPVDAVICTRAELDGDGRFTGRIGKNCKGAEKREGRRRPRCCNKHRNIKRGTDHPVPLMLYYRITV